MAGRHLYLSKVNAERLLERIRLRFPDFYFELTGKVFDEDTSSPHRYWANQVGEFLRGWSKQDMPHKRNGEVNYEKKALDCMISRICRVTGLCLKMILFCTKTFTGS